MKKEDLQASLNGIEITDEAFNAVYNLINKNEGLARQNLESEKSTLANDLQSAASKLADYEKTIESLKAKAQGNEEVEKELNDLKKAIKDREKKDAEATRDYQISQAIDLVIGDKKFVNDFTKTAIINNIKEEMDKPNNFRGVSDIFNDLTKDKMGIFEEEHKAPEIPTMGKVDESTRPTKEEFAKMRYSERVKLYDNDPEWYDFLTNN